MPKFILPKEEEKNEMEVVGCDSYARVLYVPANKEILDTLTLEGKVTVTLIGEIVGMEAREGKNYSTHEFKLELESVEVSAENEFSELADDD